MTSKTTSTDILVSPLLDGELRAPTEEAQVDVINPSNGKKLLAIPIGSAIDVDRAVRSARTAFDDGRWSNLTPSTKKKTLHRFADLIEASATALDALDAEEMGKPVSVSHANAAAAAGVMRFNAEAVDKLLGDVFSSDRHSFVMQRHAPRGVVAAVVPWNFPAFNAIYKAAPALAAGNCVVLKPSELSSRSAIHLARLALEAGIPPGVLNVVPGVGETVGRALGLHNDVDMITFTGSSTVGKLMLQYSGQSNMKVVMAECGGKSPHILFDDGVDLDAVSKSIASMLLINQGQLCIVGSRLIVEKAIERPVIDKITTHMRNIVMGDAVNPRTTFGPVASSSQCERVMHYIDTARSEGAELVTGGQRALPASGGFFIEPTVFQSVRENSRIFQEEIFGPVLSVTSFKDETEAVRLANGTGYGLAAFVWTSNLGRGMRMAKAIQSPVQVSAAVPAGEGPGHAFSTEPAKQSGVGRESGMAGIESYLRHHLVWFNHG